MVLLKNTKPWLNLVVLGEVKFLIIFANSIFSAPVQEPCPICMEMFTADFIEVHAALCGERYIL